jgi:hypothetical protein
MEFLKILLTLLPFISKLIALYSQVDIPGQDKMKLVVDAVGTVAAGGTAVATGGAKESWKEYAPVVGQLTQGVYDAMKSTDLFAQDPPE